MIHEYRFLDDDNKAMLTLVVKDYRDIVCRIVEQLAEETGSTRIELVFINEKENQS